MTKLAFIADERSGSVHATLVPANRRQETHVRLLGLTFVALLLLAVAERVIPASGKPATGVFAPA